MKPKTGEDSLEVPGSGLKPTDPPVASLSYGLPVLGGLSQRSAPRPALPDRPQDLAAMKTPGLTPGWVELPRARPESDYSLLNLLESGSHCLVSAEERVGRNP